MSFPGACETLIFPSKPESDIVYNEKVSQRLQSFKLEKKLIIEIMSDIPQQLNMLRDQVNLMNYIGVSV